MKQQMMDQDKGIKEEEIKIDSYQCKEFTVAFALDDDIEDGKFVLLFDPYPDSDDDDSGNGEDETAPIVPDLVPDFVEF